MCKTAINRGLTHLLLFSRRQQFLVKWIIILPIALDHTIQAASTLFSIFLDVLLD
jgi:hypothetical protein